MEHIEVQRNNGPRISVPKFGGWDQKIGTTEANTGYTMVFTKARADRQSHKNNDLSDNVKRQTHQQLHDHLLHHHQDNLTSNNNNKHKAHHHMKKKHDHYRHGKVEEQASDSSSPTSNPMGIKRRNKKKSWFFSCFSP